MKLQITIASVSLLLLAAVPATDVTAQQGKVVVVKLTDAPVIEELSAGFKSAFPGTPAEDFLLNDASEAKLAAKLQGASAILSIGARAALAVAKLKPAGTTIACVPPLQADPANHGATMRLQAPPDAVIASVAWMSGSFRNIGLVIDAGAKERLELLKVEAANAGLALNFAAITPREIASVFPDLVAKNDAVIVDLTEGLGATDVQYMLRIVQEARKPLIGTSEGFIKAGAPAAVSIDPRNVGGEAGRLAAQKTSGMFDPRRFRLLVNLTVMERLGVTVPQDRGTVESNILTIDTEGQELRQGAKPVAVTRPAVKKQGRLVFPAIAASTGVRQAEVVLEVIVKPDGTVGTTKVIRGEALFATAAVDSIKNWQFKPGTRDGTPVEAPLRLNLKFQK